MPKFRPVVTVDAEQYKPGMEDGFLPTDVAKAHGNFPKVYTRPSFVREDRVPVIEGPRGYEFPQEGDWVVAGHNGNRFVVRPDEFKKGYEPVDKKSIDWDTHRNRIANLIKAIRAVEPVAQTAIDALENELLLQTGTVGELGEVKGGHDA